ncbi:MAG: SIR2 family protein [Ignavibacteriaceae bacterium]|nr:SIR2 family protein [Ignavibacteriaceae bacterium]
MQIETAIFLGAGASKAEGAPLQSEMFYEYFSSNSFKHSHDEMDRELASFFQLIFGIDVDHNHYDKSSFPTFEETLGLTDLAILRKEALKGFDIENRASKSGRLRNIAQYLMYLVAKVLDSKLEYSKNVHRTLLKGLNEGNKLKNTVFISTNYDILIDNAISEMRDKGFDLDYGVEFRNFERINDWQRPKAARSVFLFKPHGSLNWLYCPTCNSLEITPKEKGVVTRLIVKYQAATCGACGSPFMPIIVPPTFYKDLNNVFLSTIWNKSENILRKAKHIIFCGYSFPDADMHIKYLLKRVQTNRNNSLKFTVFNYHDGKKACDIESEQNRFKRFLGDNVNYYLDKSFEDFAENPMLYYK